MTGPPYKINLGGNTPKIGNTPKQLFHAWRTFKFDESTDSIDSLCLEDESGHGNAKLWRDANIREL